MIFGKRNNLKSVELDLGTAVFDGSSGHLYDKDGNDLNLRHQAREVLKVLAENAGETVSRDTLVEKIWSGRSVSPDSVAQCIAEIRRALKDDEKRLIETVPREGYRLVLPKAHDKAKAAKLLVTTSVLLAVFLLLFWVLLPAKTSDGRAVVAVLPFDDFSPAEHRGVLSDAISEGVITELAHYPEMMVIARRSSFQFQGNEKGLAEIARQLGADYLLEGSQQFDGSRVRVTAQLIKSESEAHIWADEIDVPLGQLLSMNRQISRRIANAIGTTVTSDAATNVTAGDVSALLAENVARTRMMQDFSKESWQYAMKIQQQSIEEFPASAWGYLGQALALRNGVGFGWLDNKEVALDQAEAYARKAVSLDSRNYMAHYALGRILMTKGEMDSAISSFEHAARLNPSSALVLDGMIVPYLYRGENERALELIAKAKIINPLHPRSLLWREGWAYWQRGDCKAALEALKAMSPISIDSRKMLAAAFHCNGEQSEATKALAPYLVKYPDWTLEKERQLNVGLWTAPGQLERWLNAMTVAGMPR